MLKKIQGKDYQIKLPKKTAFTIETPPDQFKYHQLAAICACRGYGKFVILSSHLHGLRNQGCMDRIMIISPTIESNLQFIDPLNVLEEDRYSNGEPEVIRDIIRKVNEEQDEYEQYLEALNLWNIINNPNINIDNIDSNVLLKALEKGYLGKKPVPKYNNAQKGKPVISLIVDDMMGSKIFSGTHKNPFLNMCLRHRHLGKGCGLSIYMCCQAYGGTNGIPKSIRQNLTTLWLGAQKSLDKIKDVAEEIGGNFSPEDFMKAYKIGTAPDNQDEPNHNYLIIDFFPKSLDKSFRKNLNEYIVL
jgi:hypothetical protein